VVEKVKGGINLSMGRRQRRCLINYKQENQSTKGEMVRESCKKAPNVKIRGKGQLIYWYSRSHFDLLERVIKTNAGRLNVEHVGGGILPDGID